MGNLGNRILEIALGAAIVSELKCCKRCGAFLTCTTKGECCPECEWFDPIDNLCMALPNRKKPKTVKPEEEEEDELDTKDVDPETFLFEDDDEDEDFSDLPPERDAEDDEDEDVEDDFAFDDDDDDW
ncbi:MAG: hypothetical protein ACFFFK_06675 [Candidatus Thorarchaeota archaeon]